ncbi:helix-turn-helix transcriptional regulator [Mucilaginibacter achroorhodeus]|uniref:Helix-turn-helix transcriptional regulator n=1 Tax=Mucilaginibacter achroorhodeus TaxID=2599294 RepID=A0A563U632_9SPHI|nr:helix-turn-helix transcriptional regulator [Mucilaginibacter achroorhodeus]TWR26774.1 helix-turn-helix transcriptional regulator [Mucilaginibacter achroorhodeus]
MPMYDRAEEINKLFGRKLREIRNSQKLSQYELWLISGIATSQIGKIERGTGNPTLATIVSLARALKVPFDDLMPRELLKD